MEGTFCTHSRQPLQPQSSQQQVVSGNRLLSRFRSLPCRNFSFLSCSSQPTLLFPLTRVQPQLCPHYPTRIPSTHMPSNQLPHIRSPHLRVTLLLPFLFPYIMTTLLFSLPPTPTVGQTRSHIDGALPPSPLTSVRLFLSLEDLSLPCFSPRIVSNRAYPCYALSAVHCCHYFPNITTRWRSNARN